MALLFICYLLNVGASILVACWAYNRGFLFWKPFVGGLLFSAPISWAYFAYIDQRDYDPDNF